MGGGGKGGGGSQTVETNPQPWGPLKPYLKQGYRQLRDLQQEGPPAYYPGSTISPQSPYSQQAIQSQAQRAIAGSPITAGAQGLLTDTLSGQYLDPSSNPYLSGTIDAAVRPVVENYSNVIAPNIASGFSGAGRYGSNALASTQQQAGNELMRQIGDISSNIAYQNYGDERQRQIQGMLMSPQISGLDYFDIGQLGSAGAAQEAYGQREIDADIDRYNYEQNADWNQLAEYLGLLNQTPWGQTSTTTGGGSNTISGILGGGLQGLGVGNMLGMATPWTAGVGLLGGALGGIFG